MSTPTWRRSVRGGTAVTTTTRSTMAAAASHRRILQHKHSSPSRHHQYYYLQGIQPTPIVCPHNTLHTWNTSIPDSQNLTRENAWSVQPRMAWQQQVRGRWVVAVTLMSVEVMTPFCMSKIVIITHLIMRSGRLAKRNFYPEKYR